jgi:hypothetical protein
MSSKRARAAARRAAPLLLLGVAVLVRTGILDRQGLWADELFSLGMATGHSLEHNAEEADPARGDYVERSSAQPPSFYSRYLEHERPSMGPTGVVRAVRLSDTNPPLYYLMLGLWTRVWGVGDGALRAFSLLASLACLPLIASLARATGGRGAVLPAALLFALSPICVYYSTEGRMYALLWLFTAATMWLVLELSRTGSHVGRAVLLVVAGAGGLYTHYFFVFVWAAAMVWVLIHPGRCARGLLLAVAGLTILAALPWFLEVPDTLSRWRVTGYWLSLRPSPYSPLRAALNLPWSYLSIRVLGQGPAWADRIAAILYLALAVAGGIRLGLSALSPRRRLLWLCVVAACLGPILVDAWRGTYTMAVPRYASTGMPAAFVLVGVALARLHPVARGGLVGAIAVLCLIGVRDLYGWESRNGEPFREVGVLLSEEAGPDDMVIVHSIPSGVSGVARYMTPQAPGAETAFASWVTQLGQRRVPEDLMALAAGRKRVIHVDLHAVGAEAPERDWLLAHASLAARKRRGAATLLYFVPEDGERFPAGATAPVSAPRVLHPGRSSVQ